MRNLGAGKPYLLLKFQVSDHNTVALKSQIDGSLASIKKSKLLERSVCVTLGDKQEKI